jgi:hypothetical protein
MFANGSKERGPTGLREEGAPTSPSKRPEKPRPEDLSGIPSFALPEATAFGGTEHPSAFVPIPQSSSSSSSASSAPTLATKRTFERLKESPVAQSPLRKALESGAASMVLPTAMVTPKRAAPQMEKLRLDEGPGSQTIPAAATP